mgnify:CR=1 FL=1
MTPNGFSYYKGQYHQFYQYNPYDVRWAPMHWGSRRSTDLLHWGDLPCALAPDPRQTMAPAASLALPPRWMTASSC